MKFKRKKLTLLFLILFILLSVNLAFVDISLIESSGSSIKKGNLKTATPWTFKKILINDLTGSGNGTWTDVESTYEWCSGQGTWDNPYILENITIEGDFTTNGIEIRNSEVPFIIRNCNISQTGPGDIKYGAIKLNSTKNGMITQNNCSYNDAVGINLQESENNTIISNFIKKNQKPSSSKRYGISLERSIKNTIKYNTILENYYGIYLKLFSHNNTIFKNNVDDNTYGIWIAQYCLDNTLDENEIENNYDGIVIRQGSNNTKITNNLIDNNNYGINIEDITNLCNSTICLQNTLINPINAKDNGTNTQWDNGVIGNYWSDYTGKDLNDDGIGDTPYVIDTYRNIRDNFPIFSDGDDIPPQITINSPTENTTFGIMAPEFSIDISDPNLDKSWYTINNGETTFNFTNSTIRIDQVEWEKTSDGIVNCSFYGNDTNGNQNSLTIKLIKDTLLPALDFKGTNINGTTIQSSPNFTITITEKYLDSVWVKIFEKGTDQTYIQEINISEMLNVAVNSDSYEIPIQIDETTWNSFHDGEIELTVYANDTAGNIGSMNILVNKGNAPGSNIPFGDVYIIIVFIGVVSTILIIKTKKEKSNL